MKKLISQKPFTVLVTGPDLGPFAYEIQTAQLISRIMGIALVGAALLLLSLLFFRELEINRVLQEKIIELETREKLRSTAIAPAPGIKNPADASPTKESSPSKSTEMEPMAAPEVQTKTDISAEASPPARINEVNSECGSGQCAHRITLVPTDTGVSQGYLLVILEADVPRIGTPSGSESQQRKKYLIYPGNQTKDSIDLNSLALYEMKAFRFARILESTIVFTVGNLLRPVAVNVYVFDSNKNLVQHERKSMALEDP